MFNQQLFPLLLLLLFFSPHNDYSNNKKMQNNQEHVNDERIEYLPFEFLEAKKV